jgi:hypothetical protein
MLRRADNFRPLAVDDDDDTHGCWPRFVRLDNEDADESSGEGLKLLFRILDHQVLQKIIKHLITVHNLRYGRGGLQGAAYTAGFDAVGVVVARALNDVVDRKKKYRNIFAVEAHKLRKRQNKETPPMSNGSLIKVRLNKSFLTRRRENRLKRQMKEEKNHASDDSGVAAAARSAVEEDGILEIDAAITRELDSRVRAIDLSAPLGWIAYLFVRGVDLSFVVVMAKSFFVLGVALAIKTVHDQWWERAHRPLGVCATPIAYDDCSPIERFSQCCLM